MTDRQNRTAGPVMKPTEGLIRSAIRYMEEQPWGHTSTVDCHMYLAVLRLALKTFDNPAQEKIKP